MGKLLNETAAAAPETAAVMPAMPPRRLRRRAAPTPLDAVIDPCSIFAAKKAMHFDPTDIYSVMPQPTSAKAAEVLADQRRKRRLSITEGQGLPPIVLGEDVPRTFVNFGATGPDAASPLRAPVVLRGSNWFAPDCQKETLLPTPREHATAQQQQQQPVSVEEPKPLMNDGIDDGAAIATQVQPEPATLQETQERQLETVSSIAEPPRVMPTTRQQPQQPPPRSPLRQARKTPPSAPKRHGSFKDKVKAFFKTGACHADTTRDKQARHPRYIPRDPSLLVRRDATNTQPLVVAAPTTALMRSASQIERRSVTEQPPSRRAVSVDLNRQPLKPIQSRGGADSFGGSMSGTYRSRAGPGSADTPLKRQSSFSDKVKDFMRGPTSETPKKSTSNANTPRKKSASSESFTPKVKPTVKPFDPAESFGNMRNPLLPPNSSRGAPLPQDVVAAAGPQQALPSHISPRPEPTQPTVRFADSPKQPTGNRGLDEFTRPREAAPLEEPVRQPLATDDIAAFNGAEVEAVPRPPDTTDSPIRDPFGRPALSDLARPYHAAEKHQYSDLALRREHMAG